MKIILLFVIISFSIAQIELVSSTITYHGSHPLHDWSGTSISAQIKFDCNDSKVCSVVMNIPVDSFNSNNENRDSNMYDVLEGYYYPQITYMFKDLNLISIQDYYKNNGVLTLHGVSNDHNLNVHCTKNNSDIFCDSDFDIRLTDFNIERPSLLFMKIEDLVQINCSFHFNINP
jgi:polyisoprenoid-binding protein YceI